LETAKKGDSVKIHYTGRLDDGEVFDSSKDREPLSFTLGSGQVIPGFDEGVTGMAIGEEKTIKIPHTQAYGERKPELLIEVERAQLPKDLKPKVGMQLSMTTEDGREAPVLIKKVEEAMITLDANHPLAGKDLTFDLTLVAIG